MCHFLWLGSPLTLSEVRSMLPRGVTADVADSVDRHRLAAHLPALQTAARLAVGACACDLFVGRDPHGRSDEVELRQRYRRLAVPRDGVLVALDRHRRREAARASGLAAQQTALAAFVAEHARNAGPTLFVRTFAAVARLPDAVAAGVVVTRTAAEVRRLADGWLAEDQLTLVVP